MKSDLHQEWQAEIKPDRRRKGKREVHRRREILRERARQSVCLESLDTSHAHCRRDDCRWCCDLSVTSNIHKSGFTERKDCPNLIANHKTFQCVTVRLLLALFFPQISFWDGDLFEPHLSPFTPPHAIDCFCGSDGDDRRRTRHSVSGRRSPETRPRR